MEPDIRRRRVRNLKPCHEINYWGWRRVLSVEADEFDSRVRWVHVEGRSPIRTELDAPFLSRLAAKEPAR